MQREISPGLLRIIGDLFPGRERWLLAGLAVLTCVSAVLETAMVASIGPFFALLLNPALLEGHGKIAELARMTGVTTPRGALLMVGGITVSLLLLNNVSSALLVLAQQRFAARTEIRLMEELYAGYLRQPYAFHIERDAPSLLKVLITDITMVMQQVITPAMLSISKGLTALGIVILLFIKSPVAAALVLGVVVTTYWVVLRVVRQRQHALGQVHRVNALERHRMAQEGFGGIKELLVLGREDASITRFGHAATRSARARAANMTVSQLPQNIVEAVVFGGSLLVTLALVANTSTSAQTLLPALALYAFAGYRLMPGIQQTFAAIIMARFSYPTLVDVHHDFQLVAATPTHAEPDEPGREMSLCDAIRLRNVSFWFPQRPAPVLVDVDLTIHHGETVGFVGRTGAGKTTLADVILGLHEPATGTIMIDDAPLNRSTRRAWRRRVGYVSQHVFLANASIAENIAFGIPKDAIDMLAVQRAAHLAQADEFIASLPKGFDTLAGERGVKLSGGQRQRIGIARALYGRPDVLVFDEATSALDGLTEDAVMEAIRALGGERTVILIAHRLRTVEACDRIVMLEEGQIVADGSYRELLHTSPAFRRLAKTGHDGEELVSNLKS